MEDYYSILEIERSSNLSKKQITKQYRKLALKWHPDRNLDNPDACTYEILSDEKSRADYEIKYRNYQEKEKRLHELSFERRKMKEDLDKREAKQKDNFSKNQGELIKKRVQEEIERLRQQFIQEKISEKTASLSTTPLPSSLHTITIKWKEPSIYTLDDIRFLFSKYGIIQNIFIKTQTAIIEFSTDSAIDNVMSFSNSDPFLSPFSINAKNCKKRKDEIPDSKDFLVQKSTMSHSDFENSVLNKLRKVSKS